MIFTNHFCDHDEFGTEVAAGCVEAEASHEEHDAVDAVDGLRRRELACRKKRRHEETLQSRELIGTKYEPDSLRPNDRIESRIMRRSIRLKIEKFHHATRRSRTVSAFDRKNICNKKTRNLNSQCTLHIQHMY